MIIPISLSQAWVGVVGALGGVAITGLIALVTAFLNHRWTAEATRETRTHEAQAKRGEIRRAAYARLLAAGQNMRDAVEAVTLAGTVTADAKTVVEWLQANPDLLREAQTAGAEASIVAGDDVYHAIDAYTEALNEYLGAQFRDSSADNTDADAAQEALLEAMRQEQAADMGR